MGVAKDPTMSPTTQLKATLGVGLVLSIALMWNVERDSLRGRPHHRTSVEDIQKTTAAAAQKAQPSRI